MTFEKIVKCDEDEKEKNRIKLYEDVLEIKKKVKEEPEKAFSEDTNDDENKDIKKEENVDEINENNKKRGRFSSI